MQSFRSFGLLLEEQWPATGPEKWPTAVFRSMDHPTNARVGLQQGLKLCMRGFLDARVVWRPLFCHLMSR